MTPDRSNLHVRRASRSIMLPVAALATGLAIAAIFVAPESASPTESFESRALQAAERLVSSPADLEAYLTLTELGLDTAGGKRLWKDAAAGARQLAPNLDDPDRNFVRAGLLHWYELSESERDEVLSAAAELLDDEHAYREMWQPLLFVTRNPRFLADHAPNDHNVMVHVRHLAATWGDFGSYRRLNREIDAALIERLPGMELSELVASFERLELTSLNLAMAKRLSSEIERRPRPVASWRERIDRVRDRWSSRFPTSFPARASDGSAETPALDTPKTVQLGGSALWQLTDEIDRIVIDAEKADDLEGPVLLEVIVDGRLLEARAVESQTTIDFPLPSAPELIELRVANPRNRNNELRRLEITIRE